MVDRELVLRKLAEIELYVSQLSEFAHLTAEAYRSDWKAQRIIERTLQMAIETCLDVSHHVIADRGLRVPKTYAETFDVLAESSLLQPGLRRSMVAMTGFRNVLVHEYAEVDAEVVVRLLNEHLGDFGAFVAAAQEWV